MAVSDAAAMPMEPLFPRLRGGLRQMTPDQVAGDQRIRLMGAMIETVARRGYSGVTLRELVALAGISKSTFYEHFESKEACFLATYDMIVELATEQVQTVHGERAASDPRDRLLAALKTYADLLVAQPAAASLVVVDSLSLGAPVAARREQATETFERVLQPGLEQGGEVSEVTRWGIVGGVRRVVYRCLRSGHPERFAEHAEDIADWALSYRCRGATRVLPHSFFARRPELPTPDDEGVGVVGWEESPSSPRSRATLTQRERIVRAVAKLVAERSYAALSVPGISATAGVSNQTFYQEFGSKQEAFLAAFDALAGRVLRLAGASYREQHEWPEAVGAALWQSLSFLATEPVFAQLAFFELAAAGPDGLDHSDRVTQQFMAFLSPAALPDGVGPMPEIVVEAIGGGIWTVISHEIAHGRAESLPALAPEIADFALAPFGVLG